jgi:glycyl-tRNA synthetase beta chain
MRTLTDHLCKSLEIPAGFAVAALRAAELAKADLTSSAVVEFTELQGVMGAYYAREQGETAEVATAIEQHYRPRFAGDVLPDTLPGQLVSLADKVDTIVGIFAVGKAPKGTSDPFALRRSAIGVLRIVMDALPMDIAELTTAAMQNLPKDLQNKDLPEKVNTFLVARLDSMLRDKGISTEVVNAVLATTAALWPEDALRRCEALQDFLLQGDAWENLSTAYIRAKNLSDAQVGTGVDSSLLGAHERVFYEALEVATPRISAYMAEHAYGDYLTQLAALRTPVDDFFEHVMIMDEDPALRQNRLALLNLFIALIEPFADFRRLSK